MKIYKDIIQGTPEWLDIRYGKIGGSSAEDLNANEGKSVRDNAIYDEILSCKFEENEYEEQRITPAMERGNTFEPYARAEFERLYNVTVDQIGWAELDNGMIGISPDGLIGDKRAIEIKCPSAATHMKYIRDNSLFIKKYVWQLTHYFLVLNVDSVTCISYRPENLDNPLLVFDVTLDTVVKVSAKKTCTIRELVAQSEARCNELIECIKEDIEKYKKQTIEF